MLLVPTWLDAEALRYVNTYSPPNHYHDRPGEIDFLFIQMEKDIGLKIKTEIVPAERWLRMLKQGDFELTALASDMISRFPHLYCEAPITSVKITFFSNDPSVTTLAQVPKGSAIYIGQSLFDSLTAKYKDRHFEITLDTAKIPPMFARKHIHYVIDLDFRLPQGLKDLGHQGEYFSENLQSLEFTFCVNKNLKNHKEVLRKVNAYIKEQMAREK